MHISVPTIFLRGGLAAFLVMTIPTPPASAQSIGNNEKGSQQLVQLEASRKSVFAGDWVGNWTNDLGESGQDTLTLVEDASGNIQGTWSGNISVSGKRVGQRTAEFWGGTSKRAYEASATIDDDQTMTVTYTATRLDSSGSYRGASSFSRMRK